MVSQYAILSLFGTAELALNWHYVIHCYNRILVLIVLSERTKTSLDGSR